MSEETEVAGEATEATEEEVVKDELVMCYVSKRMVRTSETIEVVYSPTRKYRVLPEFKRFADA